MVDKLASAIYLDVVAGLAGVTSNPTISIDELKDAVIEERLQIIKEYSLKNLIPKNDLLMAINCVPVDCKSMDKCPISVTEGLPHFEIPQFVNDYGDEAIEFIGSVNRETQFKVYTSTAFYYQKHARRGSNKPFVYIEPTPNENNMYDGWIFNAPFIKMISIIAIFKDPRQLEMFSCSANDDLENYTFISAEIKKRLTEKKLRYYRMFYQAPQPNNQVAR